MVIEYIVIGIILVFVLSGIRIIRPTHKAAIVRFGKYKRFKESGITWIIPIIEKMR